MIALHVAGKIEVVIDTGREFAKLRAVGRATVCQTHLLLVSKVVGKIERCEEVVVVIERRKRRRLLTTGVGDEFCTYILKSNTTIYVKSSDGEFCAHIAAALCASS